MTRVSDTLAARRTVELKVERQFAIATRRAYRVAYCEMHGGAKEERWLADSLYSRPLTKKYQSVAPCLRTNSSG